MKGELLHAVIVLLWLSNHINQPYLKPCRVMWIFGPIERFD